MRTVAILCLVVSLLGIVAGCINYDHEPNINHGHEPQRNWNVSQKGSVVEIAYGLGTDYTQYAALHLESSYFRMRYGPESGWGTSLVLFPAFWEKGRYYQGAPISSYTWKTEGSDLLISFRGNISQLDVSGNIRIAPPGRNLMLATISVNVEGAVELDERPGEAFKPVTLSSMHIPGEIWDTQGAYVDHHWFKIPEEGWIIWPPVESRVFELRGGTSIWKTNAPTIQVILDRPLQITGWVTRSSNPNDDNVGFWAASDQIIRTWEYTVVAKR